MKKFILVAALAPLVLPTQSAFAQSAVVAAGHITTYITGFSTGAVRVVTDAAAPTSMTCGAPASAGGGYVTDPSDPANVANQSALLAAYTTGHLVTLYLSGCSSDGFPKIYGLSIVNF